MPNLRRKFRETINTKQDALKADYGILGNNEGVVAVAGRPGFSYVRYGGQLLEILNLRVPPYPDWEVAIGEDPILPGVTQVLSVYMRSGGEENAGSAAFPTLGAHGQEHALGGRDPAPIWMQQIMNGRVTAYQGLTVIVYPIWVVLPSNIPCLVQQETPYDLTDLVPTTTGKARWVLVSIDETGVLSWDAGSEADKADLNENFMPIVPDDTLRLLALIRLYQGQTAIIEALGGSDIIHLHFSNYSNQGLFTAINNYLKLDASNDPITGALDVQVRSGNALRVLSLGDYTQGYTFDGDLQGWAQEDTPVAGHANLWDHVGLAGTLVQNAGAMVFSMTPQGLPGIPGDFLASVSPVGLTVATGDTLTVRTAMADGYQSPTQYITLRYTDATETSVTYHPENSWGWRDNLLVVPVGDNGKTISKIVIGYFMEGWDSAYSKTFQVDDVFFTSEGTEEVLNVDANDKQVDVLKLNLTAIEGIAPMVVASTTLNTNLNADLLDGQHASEINTAHAIDDLTDVDLTIPPTTGQVLTWSEDAWIAGDVSSGSGLPNPTTEKGDLVYRGEGGINVATLTLGASAVLSTTYNGYVASNAIDENDGTTAMASNPVAGRWIRIDLGAEKVISGWRFYQDTGLQGASQYLIEYSHNDADWTSIITRDVLSGDETLSFSLPVTARYFRFTATAGGANGWAIWSIELFVVVQYEALPIGNEGDVLVVSDGLPAWEDWRSRMIASAAAVSNPPTDAELDTAFGTPAAAGAGYTRLLDNGGSGSNVYLVASDGANWWYQAMTKAT